MREIPLEYIVAGTKRIDLRKVVEDALREKKSKLDEIRYREVGFNMKDLNLDLHLKKTKYKASGGDEYFLEIVNKDNILFGLLRLRIFIKKAIIREIHVYGPALKLGEKGNLGQHKGFGKLLLEEAEKIVLDEGIKDLKIISGVGVREYYKKFGYETDKEGYVVKKFK